MVQKIKTVNKVSINNVGEYYIARVIIKFIHDLKTNKTNPIYYEYAFDLIDIEAEDEEGNTITIQQENIIKTFPQATEIYSNEQVNYFFSLRESGVISMEELQILLRDSLLADTINQNRYNTTGWEIYN